MCKSVTLAMSYGIPVPMLAPAPSRDPLASIA